jgi:hypothetical protein
MIHLTHSSNRASSRAPIVTRSITSSIVIRYFSWKKEQAGWITAEDAAAEAKALARAAGRPLAKTICPAMQAKSSQLKAATADFRRLLEKDMEEEEMEAARRQVLKNSFLKMVLMFGNYLEK